jgi:REP element-mobilizing transposase RayT
LFVTFRLHGTLPSNRIFPPARLTSGRAFVALDRILDAACNGPQFLREPELASLVIQALWDGHLRMGRYHLHAFVVMPNHVHVLTTPQVPTAQWLGPLKGYTGHEANRMLPRKGPFWQDESYNHLVRNDEEFRRIQHYIERNPVKAGLVSAPEEFPWSSVTPGQSPAAAQKG